MKTDWNGDGMRGVMDRARPHYAVVSRELPYQPDGP